MLIHVGYGSHGVRRQDGRRLGVFGGGVAYAADCKDFGDGAGGCDDDGYDGVRHSVFYFVFGFKKK